MLRKIDEFLIERVFEPSGRFLQRWIGVDCLLLGLLFLILAAMYQSVLAVQGPASGRPIAVASWVGWLMGIFVTVDEAAAVRRAAASGFRNPLQERYRRQRCWALPLFAILTILLATRMSPGTVVSWCFVVLVPACGVYFVSSTPDPAAPSRLRLGLRWLGAKIRSIALPAPAPSPA